MQGRTVTAGTVAFSNEGPVALIAGPCQMESRAHALETAQALKEMTGRVGIGLVYKSSFDKANRTSLHAERGIGLEASLPPAFLCRQTDLLLAAAATGRVVNVKKGQFLSPLEMTNVVNKLSSADGGVLVTERGTTFGYNTLVTDMRALPVLAQTGAPVIFDATHSVQQPGGMGGSSGGQREFVPVLARAAVAVGVAGVFIETHPDPDRAPSDGPNMMPLRSMEALLRELVEFDRLAKSIARNAKEQPK